MSFAPVANTDALWLIFVLTTSEGKTFKFITTSNTFQTNIIAEPKKYHYISISTVYMEWINVSCHNHTILRYTAKDLVTQSLQIYREQKINFMHDFWCAGYDN